MGYEYLTQPQIFLAPITAANIVVVGGIEDVNKAYPYLTTYQTWTSTADVNASIFPIPGNWSMLNESGSFIVTVGGVLQPSTEYTVDRDFRTLTFSAPVSAGVEVIVRQLATTAPSAQNFNNITSVSANFQNLSGVSGTFNRLLVTELTAISSTLNIVNITQYELSGFQVLGNADIVGNTTVSGLISAGNLITSTINVADLAASNSITSNSVAVNSVSAINATTNSLTAANITLTDNGTLFGTNSATTIGIGNLSARNIFLIHDPANDGVDPTIDIGETISGSFSGFRVRYDEVNNRLFLRTIIAGVSSNSVIIDRATGQVGISAIPNQALTVTGNISATGGLFVGPGTTTIAPITILSGGPLTTALPGTLERGQYGFFATPASTQRGIITTPQTYLLNADRTGPTGTGTFSIFGVGCNLTAGKYAYRIIFTATKSSANASQLQYALATTSGTIASHYYQVLGNTAAAVTTLAAPQQMSNYITTGFSTLVTVTVAGAAAASTHNTVIDGILDISADVVGLNPQFAFTAVPTTSLIKAGSYIQIWPLGSATGVNVSVGSWA